VIVLSGTTPVSGKTVTWQPNSGSANPASSSTGSDGVATTTITLPGGSGQITIQASATGAAGSPVAFTAHAAGDDATVSVINNRFDPDVVAIRAGGSVTFNYPASALQHNILPDDGKAIPSSPAVRDGPFNLVVQFPTAGEYFYHCSVHGSTRTGMFGKIVVAQ
jgi:plastocyanin